MPRYARASHNFIENYDCLLTAAPCLHFFSGSIHLEVVFAVSAAFVRDLHWYRHRCNFTSFLTSLLSALKTTLLSSSPKQVIRIRGDLFCWGLPILRRSWKTKRLMREGIRLLFMKTFPLILCFSFKRNIIKFPFLWYRASISWIASLITSSFPVDTSLQGFIQCFHIWLQLFLRLIWDRQGFFKACHARVKILDWRSCLRHV